METLVDTTAWRQLQVQAEALRPIHLTELFAADPERATAFSAEAAGLYLDYSKQRVDRPAMDALLALAAQQELPAWIRRMAEGAPINGTEHRAAAHMALRAPRGMRMQVDGHDVVPQVHAVLDRMTEFAVRVRSGQWRGHTGERITDVVNIGIGGSDFGPRMVCEALRDQADGPRVHFVANIDGAQIAPLLRTLDPARTLWIVTSKTFTTLETMTNARTARRWLLQGAGEAAVAQHFVAVSCHREEVEKFGIDSANMFEFWDWVGGRYSLWSAVGLSIMLALGPARFGELQAGAHAMDRHFIDAPLERNLPVLMGLLSVWNFNFLDCGTQVIAPYAQQLEKFIGWLQQLEMESNGKGVTRAGEPVSWRTTPVQWGDIGSNAQHAFFQMLHQGPRIHPVDFILPLQGPHGLEDHQRILIASCLAQSAALMTGKPATAVRSELQARGMAEKELEAAVPHRVFAGDRPSSTLLMPRLDGYHLGALLALYEHRAFVHSVLWQINAFDQWGVELGKQLAQDVLRNMVNMDGAAAPLDASTATLLAYIQHHRRGNADAA